MGENVPVHKVAGGDDLDVGIVGLEDELEAPPDLLLADGRHGDNLLEGTRDSFLATRDVQAGRSNGIVRSSSEISTIVNFFEQSVQES